MDIETSVYYVHLTRLIAREDYIKAPIVIVALRRDNFITFWEQTRSDILHLIIGCYPDPYYY
jgi:hypothetical protein